MELDRIKPNGPTWTELNIIDQVGPKWIECDQIRPNGLDKAK